MTLSKSDIENKITDSSKYLKEKATEMERHQSSGITDARQKAHAKLDELKKLFSSFESDLKNRE